MKTERASQYFCLLDAIRRDRKSTRLNSSHSQISYAVFCLKKKKNTSDVSSETHSSAVAIPVHRSLYVCVTCALAAPSPLPLVHVARLLGALLSQVSVVEEH